jgi:hypothetical protein
MNSIKFKKQITSALTIVMFMTLAYLPLMARERRGATVVVTLADGGQIRGELLAVKGHDLVIHDKYLERGFSVAIEQVAAVKIKRKSRVLGGLAIGFINGMAAGVLIAGSNSGGDGGERAGAAIGGLMFWGAATAIGGLAGAVLSGPEEMPTRGREPAQINACLQHLQKHARY